MITMFGVGILMGIIVGYIVRLIHDGETEAVISARATARLAHQDSAKLSRRIHRQRLVIKQLKEQTPKTQRGIGPAASLPQ